MGFRLYCTLRFTRGCQVHGPKEFAGDLIVDSSRHPEHYLARALLSRAITRKVTMLDANTGKPRTIVHIERAAKLTVSEENRDGLRLRKYRAEADLVLPTIPDEDIAA